MGLYIEIDDATTWLIIKGTAILQEDKISDDELKVCVVDNGNFKAYAVAFNEEEETVFARPDGRRKQWWKAKKKDLKLVCPLWNSYIKRGQL